MITHSTWHILGAGSLGCLWADYLSDPQKTAMRVKLIVKNPDQFNAFIEHGGIIIERESGQKKHALKACTPDQITNAISHLLVTTKAHQTLLALQSIEQFLQHGSVILLLQNGMGIQQQVAERYPHCDVLAAVSTDGANRIAPLHIVHAGSGATVIGALNRQYCDNDIAELLSILPTDRASIRYEHNITHHLWQKLAINCAINGLTALHRCRNGELLWLEDAFDRMIALCGEVSEIGKAVGQNEAVADLQNKVINVATSTAENRSSMLQDLENRRLTEMDFINGYLCNAAKAVNLATPLNQQLVEQIHSLEARLQCH